MATVLPWAAALAASSVNSVPALRPALTRGTACGSPWIASPTMRERDRGIWREFTWAGMLTEVLIFAAALDGMGFAAGEGLLVIGDNRPRLYFGMLGAAALRGLPAPVYPEVSDISTGETDLAA